MSKTRRLSAEERKIEILSAAIPLFASQGFTGTTTKQIAKAAQVSEALLYRHFPSKELLYEALKEVLCHEKDGYVEAVAQMESSTATLVLAVHFLTYLMVLKAGIETPDFNRGQENLSRLIIRSCLDDGVFAGLFWSKHIESWQKKWEASYQAAVEAGDIEPNQTPAAHLWWFAHHLSLGILLVGLPRESPIAYQNSREDLVNQAIRFCLRGMGMTAAAIRAHHHPQMLNIFVKNLIEKHAFTARSK